MGDQTVHHMITTRVVEDVFGDKAVLDSAGKIDGLSQHDFADRLNHWQAYQDRPYGPTGLPWYIVPGAQKDHSLADPTLSPMENLHRIEGAILEDLKAAHEAYARHDVEGAFQQLAKALHLLEDSYSEAHVFRGDSVHKGDPYAVLQSLNVFDPAGLSSSTFRLIGEGTHEPRFDSTVSDGHGHPVMRGVDFAAERACADLLKAYFHQRDITSTEHFITWLGILVHAFLSTDGHLTVNDKIDSAWLGERDRRLEIQDGPQPHGPIPAIQLVEGHGGVRHEANVGDVAHKNADGGGRAHAGAQDAGQHNGGQAARHHAGHHTHGNQQDAGHQDHGNQQDAGHHDHGNQQDAGHHDHGNQQDAGHHDHGGQDAGHHDHGNQQDAGHHDHGGQDAGHHDHGNQQDAGHHDHGGQDAGHHNASQAGGYHDADQHASGHDPDGLLGVGHSSDPGHNGPAHDLGASGYAPGHDAAGLCLSSYDPGHHGSGYDPGLGGGHIGHGADGLFGAAHSGDPGHNGPGHDLAVSGYAPGHDAAGQDAAGLGLCAYDPGHHGSGYDPGLGGGHIGHGADGLFGAAHGGDPGHNGPGHDPAASGYAPGHDAGLDVSSYDAAHDGSGYDPGQDASGFDPGGASASYNATYQPDLDGSGLDPGHGASGSDGGHGSAASDAGQGSAGYDGGYAGGNEVLTH